MADVTPDEGFLQKQLECGVCLVNYDLKDHIPMALFCQHTYCNSCVDTLSKKPPIKCPKCKRVCDVDALHRNFALCDILDEMCELCRRGEIAIKCGHCNRQLCSKCLDSHVQTLQGTVKDKLGQLRQEMKKSAALTLDETVLDKERSKATATIGDIQKSIVKYQEKIRKLEVELRNKVTQLRALNMECYLKWQQKITTEVEKCNPFLMKSEIELDAKSDAESQIKSLTEINEKVVKFLADIRDLQKSSPDLRDYKFVESQATPDVGDIKCQPETSSPQPTPDYTRARSIAVRGSQGSGREEFAGVGHVTCTDDRYIVSDTYNHRIKVYDRDLNLVSIFGEEGNQQHQFCRPRGLCVSPSGDLYVSDSGNNRVKVYDKSYRLIRTFGSKGSGNDQFDDPYGLALTHTGELLVADSDNYRVKVLNTEGSYICRIGSRGEGPGQFRGYPVGVAVTRDNHVLVSEWGGSRLLMFTLNGQHVRDITLSILNVQNDISIRDVTVDRVGNIIIADWGNHQLIVLNDRAEFVCVVGREGDQSGELRDPWSVAVNSNHIIVHEWGNNRIQMFEM